MPGLSLIPLVLILVPLLVVLASGLWVYTDATAHDERGTPVVVSFGSGYRSLDDFQRYYPIGTEKPMKVPNYAWYHCRLLRLARDVFEEIGEDGLKRLWAFGLSEATRHPSGWAYFRDHGAMPPTRLGRASCQRRNLLQSRLQR